MDYRKIMDFRNRSNPFAQLLHVSLVEIREGYGRSEMPVDDSLKNPQGSVHGGVLFTVADIACSGAASSHGEMIVTSSSDFHYLRAGLTLTKLVAEAHELKCGKRIMTYEVKVRDQDGVELAAGIFNFMPIGKKIPV